MPPLLNCVCGWTWVWKGSFDFFQKRSSITSHFINLTTQMLSVVSVCGKHCSTTDRFDGSRWDNGFSSVCRYWHWPSPTGLPRCPDTPTKITHKACDRVLRGHSYRSLHTWMGCFSWVYNVTSPVNMTHTSLCLTDSLWSWSVYFSSRMQQRHVIYWCWTWSP